MKKIIFFILLISSIIYTYSCKKDPFENKTVIEGYILEYGSEKPLPNVKIYFSGLVSAEAFGTEIWRTVDSISTDQNGYVYYEYNHNEVTIDKATFKTPHLYEPIMLSAINERQINDISRLVTPYAWVIVHVKNNNPINSNDRIDITVSPNTAGNGGWESFYGENIDNEILYHTSGNREDTYIIWDVKKQGISNRYTDTVSFLAHDTTYYEIFY